MLREVVAKIMCWESSCNDGMLREKVHRLCSLREKLQKFLSLSLLPGRIIHTEHEHENELQLPQASVTAIRSLPLRSSRWSKIVTSFSSVSSSLVVDIAMLMIVLSEAATLSPAAAVPQGLLSTGADQFLSTIVASGFFPPHLGLPQSFARSAACGE